MIKNLRFWFYLSIAEIVVSLVLIGYFRPSFGTDFTGGALLELKAPATSAGKSADATRQQALIVLEDQFGLSGVAQVTQDGTLLIRTSPLSEDQHQDIVKALKEKELVSEELRFETIGPTIGAELKRKAIWAVVLSVIGMICYLAYAFRSSIGLVAPWKFGVAAAYALLHDVLFVTALFVVLGRIYGVVIDSLFVTAMLSVMGYSVSDTIVIFDRFREEWLKTRQERFPVVLDRSVRLTLVRSVTTSVTILIVLVAMLLVGGTTIRWFIVALTAGTVVGTYSSIFVASPCLYYLAQRRKKR